MKPRIDALAKILHKQCHGTIHAWSVHREQAVELDQLLAALPHPALLTVKELEAAVAYANRDRAALREELQVEKHLHRLAKREHLRYIESRFVHDGRALFQRQPVGVS